MATKNTFTNLGFPEPRDRADVVANEIIAPVLHLVEEMDGLCRWRDTIATALRGFERGQVDDCRVRG